jgi:hypothetical protein
MNKYANACEFQIDLGALTAQYSSASKDSFPEPERSLRQGGSPQNVGDYAIENLTGIEKPFSVRIMVKGTPKLGGDIIDSEIAGQHTMISYRQDLFIDNISFKLKEAVIRNIKIAKIDN